MAINAQHLASHITYVRELKTKNQNPDEQEYYKLVIKFSSFQVRKDVMIFKRRRGKVVFQDLFLPNIVPPDQTKILYFNDLLPAELYSRYTRIVQFFRNNIEISIFCNEGQIFFRRNREPAIISNDFDLNLLNAL